MVLVSAGVGWSDDIDNIVRSVNYYNTCVCTIHTHTDILT